MRPVERHVEAGHADIAPCVECDLPIKWGTPYRMVSPGRFAHLLHITDWTTP